MTRFLKPLKQIPIQLVLILLSIVAMIPLYFMIATAMKSKQEFYVNRFGLPQKISFENIVWLVEHGIIRQVGNTVLLVMMSCTLGIAIAMFAAYAFSRCEFPGRDFLFNIIIALMALPTVVVIVPLFVTIARLGLTNSYFGASFVFVGFMLPFSIFVLTSFFKTIPEEILDACKIDGCGDLMSLIKIIIPMSRPPIVTLVIINSLGVWNSLLVPLLILQSNEMRTVVVELAQLKSKYYGNTSLIVAGSLFVGVPVIIAFVFGQRYFIRGFASGAIK